ncbi:hypothetical protein JCM3765_000700 [Sporobolomyces pararoseus]
MHTQEITFDQSHLAGKSSKRLKLIMNINPLPRQLTLLRSLMSTKVVAMKILLSGIAGYTEEELAELERQSRMARIRQQLAGASQNGRVDTGSVKREGEANENGVEKKKVKLEKENVVGKKGEEEVLVLSDSD